MAMNKNQNESVQQAAERPKTLRIILSIVIAFFVWMAAMLAAPEITKAIRGVPITVDIPTSAMLEVVDGADTKVSLVLDGKQFEIGSYGPENVRVVADASAITEPGTYEVPLVVSDNGTRSYTVTSISPATVTLTFETRATKLLQIQADITGLTTPANYIAPEDEIVLEPSTVEVSGAESLISRVERAVIEVDFSREVTSTQQQNSKIVYYDAEGNKLETEEVAYFHQDVSSVAVTVPVKRVATLPLTVSFLNVPENFPVDELSYSLSVDSITVAAEDSVLRNHSSLVLGYIDFKQMNLLTSSQMDFAVQLPEGFTDMDDIEVVTVSFEADDLASTNLSLKNFQLVNVPEGFTVTVEESALRVYVLGKKSIISGIAAGDFVVKVDLSDMRTRAGKYEMPVSIYAPTKGYVWAVGEYSVTVDAKAS
jgi:YbbR domain-containing protein